MRFCVKNEVCRGSPTILFAKNKKRWYKRATLLNSAFGAANQVGRSHESYCIGAHPNAGIMSHVLGPYLPKVLGNIGCPREPRKGGGRGRRERPPWVFAFLYIRDFS